MDSALIILLLIMFAILVCTHAFAYYTGESKGQTQGRLVQLELLNTFKANAKAEHERNTYNETILRDEVKQHKAAALHWKTAYDNLTCKKTRA